MVRPVHRVSISPHPRFSAWGPGWPARPQRAQKGIGDDKRESPELRRGHAGIGDSALWQETRRRWRSYVKSCGLEVGFARERLLPRIHYASVRPFWSRNKTINSRIPCPFNDFRSRELCERYDRQTPRARKIRYDPNNTSANVALRLQVVSAFVPRARSLPHRPHVRSPSRWGPPRSNDDMHLRRVGATHHLANNQPSSPAPASFNKAKKKAEGKTKFAPSEVPDRRS